MANVRKTITGTPQQDACIKTNIDAGHNTHEIELIRDPIQHEQKRTAEMEAVRRALIEGEKSGEPSIFDVTTFKQRMIGANG